jgi:hypothetical protein
LCFSFTNLRFTLRRRRHLDADLEVLVEDGEVLDRLEPRELRVALVERLLDRAFAASDRQTAA